jgi:hypothetical protein
MQGTTTGHVPFVSNGIGIVVLANSALILASMFGFVALEHVFAAGPPSGRKLFCLSSLFAVVPTQIVLAAGWTAIGQQPWSRRIMVSAGALLWIDLLLIVVEGRTGYNDFGGLVVQGIPALLVHGVILWLVTFALLRPLSIAWEFGNHPALGCRGQFRLIDIGEWTVAVALPLALIQVLDSVGRSALSGTLVCALVLTCCVVVVVSGGLWRNMAAVMVIQAAIVMLVDGSTLYLLRHFGYAQQTWIPTILGGLVIGSTCVATINLLALQMFGYRVRQRSASALAVNDAPAKSPAANV